jgi:methyl acetate hydrolase
MTETPRLDPAALDAILERAVAEGRVPGVAAVVTDRDGTLYEGTAGVLQEGGPAVVARTIFR